MNNPYCLTLNFKVWIEEEIMCIRYFTDTLTVQIAELAVETRLQMSEGLMYPAFADVRLVRSVEPAARKLLSNAESTSYISAGAILIRDNQFQKVAGNFFLQVIKPKIPSRLFTSEADAKAWLKESGKMRMTG